MSFLLTSVGGITINFTLGKNRSNGKDLVVQIKDTGEGINPDFLDNVFSFNAIQDSELLPPIKDTIGIDLLIARTMIERLGGQLKVKSYMDMGTEIKFTIKEANIPKPKLRKGHSEPSDDVVTIKDILHNDEGANTVSVSHMGPLIGPCFHQEIYIKPNDSASV